MPDLEPITREEMLLDGQDLEPITRKEMFIKRIYDKTQVVPEPITREEMFLKKAGDETTDVTIEQLNVSENGTYSEEGVAYSPVIVNVPAPPIPDNAYLLNEVEGLPSDIAPFTDGSNLPMPSLKVSIEPIQEGSGDPSPTNIRPISGWSEANVSVCGKNLFDESILLECSGWTVSDGVYSGDSVQVNAKYGNGVPKLAFKPNTQYTFSLTYGQDGSAGIGLAVAIRYTDDTITQKYYTLDTIGFVSVTSTAGKSIKRLELSYGANRTIHLSNMQLEEGSSATTYEPYNGQTYTIPFTDAQGNPVTVYGGECDVVNGTVKPNIEYDSYNGETLVGRWISDRDVYAEGTTPTIGAQVVDLGAYGSDISVQPTSIKSQSGVNNVWADCGQILEGEYFSESEEE